jgi:uncharacterized protein (DUF2336 family)
MPSLHPDLLERLSGLATERSSERRIDLLREVTDLFLSDAEGHSTNAMALFDDVMTRIADDVSESVRAELSARVADVPRAPRSLVRRLAGDVIAVARAVLQRSPALADQVLVEVASSRSNAHLLAISLRAILSPVVTDVLVERGDDRVVESVAQNQGARFSARGYATLVERAAENEELQMRLALRRDLDEDAMEALIPALSEKVRLTLTRRGLEGGNSASFALAERLKARIVNADQELREVIELAARIKAGTRDPAETVLRLSKARRSYDLSVLLGLLAGVPKEITIKSMQRRQNEPILIICRALALPWPAVDAILAMKAAKFGELYRSAPSVRRSYEMLTSEAAERAMRLLKVRAAAADGSADEAA